MSITAYIQRVVFLFISIFIFQSCTIIKRNSLGLSYYKSEKYYGLDQYELSEAEFAEQLNDNTLDYYETLVTGEIHANLVKREVKSTLPDSSFFYELEKSLEIKLEGKPLYIAYFDIQQGFDYTFYYVDIRNRRNAHPENQYLIVFSTNYIEYDEDSIDIYKDDLIKIDSRNVMADYISCPGHFGDHWINIDMDMNVDYYLGEGGIKVFKEEGEKTLLNGMKCYEEGNQIDAQEFQSKSDSPQYLKVYTKIEDEVIAVLIFKERKGQLEYESFKKQLSASLDTEIDFSKPLVIAFFESVEGIENTAHLHLKSDEFKNQIKKNPEVNHLFILDKDYTKQKAVIENAGELPVVVDRHGLIQQVISRYDIVCENWIAIQPDGRYFLYYGEAEKGINLRAALESSE